MLSDQQLVNWKDFATVKQWKKNLKINSKSNKLSPNTDDAIGAYMPLFLEFKQKNPDQVIEEALVGKHVVRETLSDFCTWMQDVKGKSFNSAIHAAYHVIRGFYSHNDINTQKISTPVRDPSKVQFDDDRLPLFEIKEVQDDGETVKVKIIRRDLLKSFYDCLSTRDKIIAMCIKDSGLDSGDLLSLPLSILRFQDLGEERLFIRMTRGKTRELVCTFFTKETTRLLRNYEKMYRSKAMDTESIFAQSIKEFKSEFTKKHGRPYIADMDEMILKPLTPHGLSANFRNATKKLEKLLSSDGRPVKLLFGSTQSPLRPKRFRKLFSDACDDAGIPTDIKRVFMGKSDPANKTYEGKSRQNLEIYYEKIEPRLTIYSEPVLKESEKVRLLEKKLEEEQDKRLSSEKLIKEQIDYIMSNLPKKRMI